MGIFADHELRIISHVAPFLEVGDLLDEGAWIDDHSISDDTFFPLIKDARGNNVKHELLFLQVDRMACIVASLEPYHHICILGEQVDNLSLPFIAPLRSYNDDISHRDVIPFQALASQLDLTD